MIKLDGLSFCPRRKESDLFWPPKEDDKGDTYHPMTHACSHCGSLDPDIFMSRLEDKTIILSTTDKNYKVYVNAAEDSPSFIQRYHTDSKPFEGDDSANHDWVKREVKKLKFYFQHLSHGQRERFIELYNAKAFEFSSNIGFYVFPFFMVPVDKS